MASFSGRSRDELLRQMRFSTELRAGYTEAENVVAILEQAGFVDGVDFISQDENGTPTIDVGMHVVPVFHLDDESPLTELWDMAGACGGMFFANPDGMFAYRNALWLLHITTPSLYLDRSRWQSYDQSWAQSELYSDLEIEMNALALTLFDVVWTSDDLHTVRSGDTLHVTAEFRQPSSGVVAPVQTVDYEAASAGGYKMTSHVTVMATIYAQRAELSIYNGHPWRTAYMTKLQMRGAAYVSDSTQKIKKASTNAFWDNISRRKRRVGSVYIQTVPQAQMLAAQLMYQQERPTLYHNVSGVPGAPSRRLGDLVSITRDVNGVSSATTGHVIQIGWQLGHAGFWQNLTIVDRRRLYESTDYFRLGVNTLNQGSASDGQVYY